MRTRSMARLLPLLNSRGCRFELAASLSDYTTFRLGGLCPLLIEVTTPDQVEEVLQELRELEEDCLLIGGGSNLVVSDRGLDQVVICYASPTPAITRDGSIVRVSGGTVLDQLAAFCAEEGLAGIGNTSGIPGTVGGAIAGNAGAFGWQIGDCLVEARILGRDGEVRAVEPGELEFRYRDSRLKRTGEIVLDAALQLTAGSPQDLLNQREEILELRRQKHPDLIRDCCAGSFFRNLEPTSKAERRQAAGYFLEQAGAKQMRIGGAGVFPRHANIIVKADASCTAQDVYDLQQQMAAAVRAKFGFDLVREVLLLGEFRE